ncbi:MAG: ABC transporter ATP-binding protein [Candidatus Magasanikbacteria bacterium]|nr:ABC transporter ATP-binding protein [Candidatus Magasanikbacteria bacterium]
MTPLPPSDSASTQPMGTRELIPFIWRYVRPYRGRFWAGTILRLASELAFTVSPYAFAKMITVLAERAPASLVYTYFSIWMGSHFVRIAGQRCGRWFANRVRERAALDAEIAGVDMLVRWPLLAHEAENSGNKIKRIRNGAEGINKILLLFQDQWIAIVSHGLVMVAVITFISWRLGAILAAYLLAYWLITRPLMRSAGRRARRVNAAEEEVSGFIFEIANGIRTVKVMNLYVWLRARLVKLMDGLTGLIFARIKAYQGGGAIANTFSITVRMLFLAYIIWGVMRGSFEIGFLLLFNNYFANLRDMSEQLTESAEEFTIARYRLNRLKTVHHLALEPAVSGILAFPSAWQDITLTNISFAYGDNPVLKNVNLIIKRGERVGIVGLSGAGKTTLFKLLLKEHSDFTGDIKIGGTDVRQIEPNSFATEAAVVLQDTEVFNLSMRDNITLGVPESEQTEARLTKAIAVSHVADFLNRLPHGLDTLIGEKGVKLSGGERQRVGLARAIYKNPQILFLDEATSHLDLESEEKIQSALHEFFGSVTAVVIAHRLTTIKEMDRIVVLEDGTILETGTFEELYNQRGRFYDLWEKQKL